MKKLLRDFFGDDPLSVFATLVETKKLNQEEIEYMRTMLDEMQSDSKEENRS